MSFERITISVPEEIATKAARAAEAGDVESVSAYFAELAAREPDWVQARAVVDEMIAEAGELSDEDLQRRRRRPRGDPRAVARGNGADLGSGRPAADRLRAHGS